MSDAIYIQVFRIPGKRLPWIGAVMVNGDEEWTKSYQDRDDAFFGAADAYDDIVEERSMGDLCGDCSGSGEGMAADTTCMTCGGLGTVKHAG